ncbi:hypothetical protein BJY01DRAFT_223438 [Aspergillus pseudoustus]|uniref:Uncharacterized protein n=1 Tax=Aspergillus pseudoustus TaxID=1810923 RepID=A0ABR4J6C3_9EURO
MEEQAVVLESPRDDSKIPRRDFIVSAGTTKPLAPALHWALQMKLPLFAYLVRVSALWQRVAVQISGWLLWVILVTFMKLERVYVI